MAGEIQLAYGLSARSLYAVVRNSSALVWNGAAFVAYNGANWATYAVAMAEQGSSGYYVGDFPAVAAGFYLVEVRDQAGGSPAQSDAVVGDGDMDWTGTGIITGSDKTGFSLTSAYDPAKTASQSSDVLAIKAKSDKLTFTSGNDLDVNIQKVNDVTLKGDGSTTPWGPV